VIDQLDDVGVVLDHQRALHVTQGYRSITGGLGGAKHPSEQGKQAHGGRLMDPPEESRTQVRYPVRLGMSA
jgi:hypothetical protein